MTDKDAPIDDGPMDAAGAASVLGATGAGPSNSAAARIQAMWSTSRSSRRDYGKVLSELQASKLVGRSGVFERDPHVPILHMGYFKPTADAIIVELKNKDRRSVEGWEYVNIVWVWEEVAAMALEV